MRLSPSNLRQEVKDLLSHPMLVGPNGVPAGASKQDLRAVEQLYGVRMPPVLQEWFSVVNGAFCATQGFLALGDYRVDYKDFITKLWLPVADDGCGDYYLVDLTSPDQGDYPVFFWDHESGYDLETAGLTKGYAVASNVWIFSLLFLRQALRHELAARGGGAAEREASWHWPFDRDRTLQHDPALACVTSAPLPWKANGGPR